MESWRRRIAHRRMASARRPRAAACKFADPDASNGCVAGHTASSAVRLTIWRAILKDKARFVPPLRCRTDTHCTACRFRKLRGGRCGNSAGRLGRTLRGELAVKASPRGAVSDNSYAGTAAARASGSADLTSIAGETEIGPATNEARELR